MKKITITLVILTSTILHLTAGGLVSNSNQSAAYYRMLARGASTSADAVYYNPAGLAFLDQGLTISLNSQTIWMTRTLTNDLPSLNTSEFIGKLFVPVFPGVYAAYKKNNWTFSLGFNPPAGGGSVEFAKGLPMLETPIAGIPGQLTTAGIPTTKYSMESMLKGTSIVYGVQVGASYKIGEKIGVFGGVRMLMANNSYEGYMKNIKVNPNLAAIPGGILNGDMMDANTLNAKADAINAYANSLPQLPDYAATITLLKTVAGGLKNVSANITDKTLDVQQTGRGFAPLLGIHFNSGSLNLSAKYEFSSKITLTNKTKKDDVNMYPNGQKLRSDVPAMLSLAGSIDIVPALKFSLTYLHHFEPQSTYESFSNGAIIKRNELIDHGTNEFMAGLEWKLAKKLTLSTGGQLSKVGVSDAWQNDISHNLDSYTQALGAAFHFNDRMTLNIGGLYTWYTKATVKNQTYNRENKAVAIGIDYRF